MAFRMRKVAAQIVRGNFQPSFSTGGATSSTGTLVRRAKPSRLVAVLPPEQSEERRRRAFELNMSMAELDEAIGGRAYFRHPRRVNWSAVQRALPQLAGRVAVSWHGV
jgi:hypothetical protein